MSDANGWPDANNPGVPLTPERQRSHLVVHPLDDGSPDPEVAVYWTGTHYVHPGSTRRYSPTEMAAYLYLGPCLTPDEVAAREAAAAAAEREACAREVDCGCAARADVLARLATDGEKRASYLCIHGDVCCALQAAAIRARGKEPQP